MYYSSIGRQRDARACSRRLQVVITNCGWLLLVPAVNVTRELVLARNRSVACNEGLGFRQKKKTRTRM
jgi:hypothetical protein